MINKTKEKKDYEEKTEDKGEVKNKKIKEFEIALKTATDNEQKAVYENLNGIFTQNRGDLPGNNKNSEYAQLATSTNSKLYTTLYDVKNVNIFLNAFKANLANDATLKSTIDDKELTKALDCAKDGKVTLDEKT